MFCCKPEDSALPHRCQDLPDPEEEARAGWSGSRGSQPLSVLLKKIAKYTLYNHIMQLNDNTTNSSIMIVTSYNVCIISHKHFPTI